MKFAIGDRVVCLLKNAPVYKIGGTVTEHNSYNPRSIPVKYDNDIGVDYRNIRFYHETYLILERVYLSPLYMELL